MTRDEQIEVLRRMIEDISQPGYWAQGNKVFNGKCGCLITVLNGRVSEVTGKYAYDDIRKPVLDRIYAALPEQYRIGVDSDTGNRFEDRHQYALIAYNDAPARTAQEVISLIQRVRDDAIVELYS